jgi:hypothetical protein
MRLVLFAILLGVTSPALADEACSIHVIKAPKRVRAAIEARVGIESSCKPLDVRVVKRGKKLAVTARSDDGQTFRGEARDAGRAAELVMKWAAPAEEVAAIEEEAPAATAPPPVTASIEVDDTEVDRIVAVAPRTRSHDIGVGVLASPIGYGVRAEVDAFARRGVALGITLGAGDARWTTGDLMTGAALHVQDISAGAFVAKTFGSGTWRLRVQAGAGIIYTQYIANARTAPFDAVVSGSGTTRMLDASLALSCAVNAGWAVQLGPLFQYYDQTFGTDISKRTFDVGGYLAVKKRI